MAEAATYRRMPAEWETHEATWVSWPHNRNTWPGCFEEVEPAFAQLVRVLLQSEPVRINVLDNAHEAQVRRLLGPEQDVDYLHIPTDDAWCRDHGPTVVFEGSRRVAVDFRYNAWGGKYPPFDRDALAGERMASHSELAFDRVPLVLEGGAIEVNGAGLLLTTESCVLNPNRNPGLTRTAAETWFETRLGAQTVWVEGCLVGDDTDGHIDNLARFVGPKDVVMSYPSPGDSAHGSLAEAFSALERQLEPKGVRVHRLPLPRPLMYRGQRLPASYANFYITNRAVVLPAYDEESDRQAAAVLARFFPNRAIVPVDCRVLVRGLGAVHCLTQQLPAGWRDTEH